MTEGERRVPKFKQAPKPGKIHLYCRSCGRKQSNRLRESSDPPEAAIADVLCPKERCAGGAMEPETFFYDMDGNEVSGEVS